MTTDKAQRLAVTLSRVSARWGASVLRRADHPTFQTQKSLPTGFSALDQALGIGGLPCGGIVHGLSHGTAGLTTLALHSVAQAQQTGATAAWVDTALTFDAEYAVSRGVQLETLLVVRSREGVSDILYSLINSRGLGVLVCDLRGEGAELPTATEFSQISTALAPTECVLFLLTEKQSLNTVYQIALRLHLSRERWLRRGRDISGYRVQVNIVKSRFTPTQRQAGITIGFSYRSHSGDGR